MKSLHSLRILSVFCSILFCFALNLKAQTSIFAYQGEGWTLSVTSLNEETGEVFGEIAFANQKAPYRGAIQESQDKEIATCSYVFENQNYQFQVEILANGNLILHINGGSHTLRPQDSEGGPSGGNESMDELSDETRMDFERSGSASRNETRVQANGNSGTALPDQLALKLVQFPDITMGGVAAYTMLIPQDWNAQGHIEWSLSEPMYPHSRVNVTGPDFTKITFVPTMNFMYSEAKPVPGFPRLPASGVPAPRNVGEWLVSYLRENGQQKDVTLVSEERDQNAEQLAKLVRQQLGVQNQNVESTCHIIIYQYTKEGQPVTEETHLTYSRLPDYEDQSIKSQTWSIFVTKCIAARSDRFEQYKPMLLLYAGSYKSTPKWWNQMMQLRNKLFQAHASQVAATIAERGRYYDQISTEQYQSWKRQNSTDPSHKRFIQSIYEVQDYRDSNGNAVELPIHYKHAYSDGQGNYLMSNRTLQPTGNYQEIHPSN